MKPARDFVEEWLRANERRIGVPPSEMKRIDEYCEQFHAWYETGTHLIDVACWNHASCLDVIVLSKETGEMILSEAGECTCDDALRGRLERMVDSLGDPKTTRGFKTEVQHQ